MYFRACLYAPVAGMLIMANRSVPVLAKDMSVPMHITAVLARMPIALAESAYVGTSNCARTWLMKRSGMRSVDS